MILKEFVDREKDKNRLQSALKRADCQFIVVYGRRRIGKSALIKNVLRADRDLYFLSDQTSEQKSTAAVCRCYSHIYRGLRQVTVS